MFTASYKPKEKIKRPYRSLLNQTYSHWEWVIVDDSGDNDETYANDLSLLMTLV
ncbi:glycosyltransferase family A protein [Bacillus paranthracis]